MNFKLRMDRLAWTEVITTGLIAIFFVTSEQLIDSAKQESLLNFAISSTTILWLVVLPLIGGKIILLKKRLSKMAENRMPIHRPLYRTMVIVTASQSVVSMFATSVSAFALIMSLFVAFGVNSDAFHHALYQEHIATYAIFPIADLVFLLTSNLKRK